MLLGWLLSVYVELRTRYENAFLGGYFTQVKWFPFGLLLKIGRADVGLEADTLRFIRHHTTIPVPRVIASATYGNDAYTLMEKVDGMPLEGVWPRLDDRERSCVVAQIADFVRQLQQQLPRPSEVTPGMVCSLQGGPMLDSRISCHPIGPFSSESDFNNHLEATAKTFMDNELTGNIRTRMRDDHRILFTHGDLVPRNIIMRGHSIVALIDWEESGWMPEHWELVKAKWSSGMEKDSGWDEALWTILSYAHKLDWLIDKEFSDRMNGAF